MDKRKLNYRFHNPNPPEVLERELLQICIGVNMGKVESTIRESFEKQSALRVIAIPRRAQIAKFKGDTLFKMPQGEYEGKYYRISNEYIRESSGEIVLELPSEMEIQLLDETQQECEIINLDKFVKVVAGKGEKEYEEKYRLPSVICAEQIKNSPIRQTSNQFVK